MAAMVKITQGRQSVNVRAVTMNNVMTLSLPYVAPMLGNKTTAERFRQCIAVCSERRLESSYELGRIKI